MILEQQLWKAKRRHRDELAALAKVECERMGVPYLIYTPLTHPGDVIILQFQFADLAEQTEHWARWNAEPEAQVYLQQLHELAESEHRDELFRVF